MEMTMLIVGMLLGMILVAIIYFIIEQIYKRNINKIFEEQRCEVIAYKPISEEGERQINEMLGLVKVTFQLRTEVYEKLKEESVKENLILVAYIRKVLTEHVNEKFD